MEQVQCFMSTAIMDERLFTSFFLTSLDQKKIENASTIRYHISLSETCKQWGTDTAQYGLKIIFKVGFYLKADFLSRNLGLMRISCSCFKQSKNCSFISRIYMYVLWSFVNFWVILGVIWEEIVFLNGLVKFREIRI